MAERKACSATVDTRTNFPYDSSNSVEPMEKLLTNKEMAEAIGASESSMRRWTNSGAIITSRTVGGHRRIPLSEAIRFIRESHSTVVRPDILGLEGGPLTDLIGGDSRIVQTISDALHHGDAARTRRAVVSLYLGGMSIAAICDGPIATAMRRIGELWQHDERGILIEHRATDICFQIVNQLRGLLPPPKESSPLAVGGAPPQDRYFLPSMMVAAVLAEAGYREMNLGPDLPLEVLAAAAEEHGASLAWCSISTIESKPQLQRAVQKLAERLRRSQIQLILGGRMAAELVGRNPQKLQMLQSMSELAVFANGAMSAAQISIK
jgi:methanogenic corrinoid protein MtbC1